MFDVASSEFLLVVLVALVVIGPRDLPKVLRVVGQWVGKARGVANQFRGHFDEMIRQSELEEMEKKWQAENERIMREYPPPTAGETVETASDTVEAEPNPVFANDQGPVVNSPLPSKGGDQGVGASDSELATSPTPTPPFEGRG